MRPNAIFKSIKRWQNNTELLLKLTIVLQRKLIFTTEKFNNVAMLTYCHIDNIVDQCLTILYQKAEVNDGDTTSANQGKVFDEVI